MYDIDKYIKKIKKVIMQLYHSIKSDQNHFFDSINLLSTIEEFKK